MTTADSNVKRLFAGAVTPAAAAQAIKLDAALCQAIEDAIQAGLPQGLIVATLAGHAHYQTQRLIDNAD